VFTLLQTYRASSSQRNLSRILRAKKSSESLRLGVEVEGKSRIIPDQNRRLVLAAKRSTPRVGPSHGPTPRSPSPSWPPSQNSSDFDKIRSQFKNARLACVPEEIILSPVRAVAGFVVALAQEELIALSNHFVPQHSHCTATFPTLFFLL
jgi:hypothetical protein